MRKLISFAITALVLLSGFTSCEKDSDDKKDYIVTSINAPYLLPRFSCPLSDEAYAAASTAITNTATTLSKSEYTTAEDAQKLMESTISGEFAKFSNSIRYELQSKKFDIVFGCSNGDGFTYTYNTSSIEATGSVTIVKIEYNAISGLSSETNTALQTAVEYANTELAGKTIEFDSESTPALAVNNKIAETIKAKYTNLTSLDEYATDKYYYIAETSYTIGGTSSSVLFGWNWLAD